MSMQSIITKGKKFTEQVSQTVVEAALDIANECWGTYEFELSDEEATEIAKGIGGKVPARVSEWKSFMLAVPCGMPEALEIYRNDKSKTLTRVKMFALARELRKIGDYEKASVAVNRVEKGATKKGSKGGRPATLEMGLGVIRNAASSKHLSKTKLNEFRRKLKDLCEEYDITF